MSYSDEIEILRLHENLMLSNTIKWSEINSGSFNSSGVENVAKVIREDFSVLNAKEKYIDNLSYERLLYNGTFCRQELGPILSFNKRLDAKTTVLFVGHMDTVFPMDGHFQKVVKKQDNILHGPGVTDMKGGIAVILSAIQMFENHDISKDIGWQILLTPDEEIGSPASAKYISDIAKNHDVGFVYEPSVDDAGTLAGNRKGSGKFNIVARGKSAHAGRAFHDGHNAIYAMSSMLTQINALHAENNRITINAGLISGGEAVNVVPDTCTCFLDIRLETKEDQQWVQNKLDKLVNQKINSVSFELHGGFTRPPKCMDTKHKSLYELVKSVGAGIGEEISWQDTGGCCDGNNLSDAGLVNVDTLGVKGGRIHSDQEYMIISSLSERAKLTESILLEIAKKGLPW